MKHLQSRAESSLETIYAEHDIDAVFRQLKEQNLLKLESRIEEMLVQ